jgi:hypothetical protein
MGRREVHQNEPEVLDQATVFAFAEKLQVRGKLAIDDKVDAKWWNEKQQLMEKRNERVDQEGRRVVEILEHLVANARLNKEFRPARTVRSAAQIERHPEADREQLFRGRLLREKNCEERWDYECVDGRRGGLEKRWIAVAEELEDLGKVQRVFLKRGGAILNDADPARDILDQANVFARNFETDNAFPAVSKRRRQLNDVPIGPSGHFVERAPHLVGR